VAQVNRQFSQNMFANFTNVIRGIRGKVSACSRGFTVAELLVAMSLFIIFLAVAVGAFVNIIRTQRALVVLMNVNNNTGLVLEQIMREVRTGYNFATSTADGCPSGWSSTLNFQGPQGGAVTYDLDNRRLRRNGIPLSASTSIVSVDKLCFLVFQEFDYACNPWRVSMIMTVSSPNTNVKVPPISGQTTISSRVLPREVPFVDLTEAIAKCPR